MYAIRSYYAGITRDSIAVDWTWTDPASGEARPVRLIDTAGMRKRARVDTHAEIASVAMARRRLTQADVA